MQHTVKTDGQGDVTNWCRLEALPRAATKPNCLKPQQDKVQMSRELNSDLDEVHFMQGVLEVSLVVRVKDTSATNHICVCIDI